MKDELKHPEHYTHGKAECWDWYEAGMSDDEFRGAMKNNIYKYTYRAGHKGDTVKDLGKAIQYLKRWIEFERGVRYHIFKTVNFAKYNGMEEPPATSGYSLNQRYGDEPHEVSAEDWDKLSKKVYAKEWKEINPDDNSQPKESWWDKLTGWIREKVLWIQS